MRSLLRTGVPPEVFQLRLRHPGTHSLKTVGAAAERSAAAARAEGATSAEEGSTYRRWCTESRCRW